MHIHNVMHMHHFTILLAEADGLCPVNEKMSIIGSVTFVFTTSFSLDVFTISFFSGAFIVSFFLFSHITHIHNLPRILFFPPLPPSAATFTVTLQPHTLLPPSFSRSLSGSLTSSTLTHLNTFLSWTPSVFMCTHHIYSVVCVCLCVCLCMWTCIHKI